MLTVEQIQQHFIEQLNHAIRRPGMFGPSEIGLDYTLTDVVYVTETGDRRTWRNTMSWAEAWTSHGVSGVVTLLMPETEQHGAASVYADYAHDHKWLTLDRTLTAEEYGEMRRALDTWCAVDRARADVIERFGEPSVRIGGNSDQALGYGLPGEPMVWFHTADEEVVLAGRCGEPFVESLRFTPEGERRRPVDEDDEDDD
ncbi:hypothetical protein OG474_11605 [Kribbella sp. NBC_01505]|uniref:hypothetical protein n=1 Tax=Kribbella sp. NBC_01505 TaxID=2903580 RepID=UPI0038636220